MSTPNTAAPAAPATPASTVAGTRGQCFSLAGSLTCPDYGNYFIVAENSIVDVPSFDAFMTTQMDMSPNFIKLFQESFNCPGFSGNNMRFHMSTLCNFFINFSQPNCGTLNKAPYTPLCQSSCYNFINSVTSMFNDPKICNAVPDQASAANRTAFRTPGTTPVVNNLYFNYCNTLRSNDTSTCQLGVATEVANLGFTVGTDAAGYCKTTGANDPLCPAFIDTLSKSLVKLLDPPSQLPWVASAVALGVMGMIYMFLLCLTGTKRWTKATTIAHQPKAEPAGDLGYRGTIARGAANTIRRSQIMNYGTTNPASGGANTKRASIFSSMRQSFARGGSDKMPPLPQFQRNDQFDPAMNPTDDNASLIVKMRAIENYPAQLSDELDLRRGDIVVIEEMFDDGWAIGRNEATGQAGALPLSCLVPVNQKSGGGNRRSIVNQRTASLYAGRPDQ
ncbi:hypothetical protein BC829DRAFT_446286 [Chytridium lagenaria]|nr:hypothetical protein BC829DRAFT_446286 [Chytridium lagenaria]